MYRRTTYLSVLAFCALGLACGQAEQAAKDAGSATTEHAAAATRAVEGAVKAADDATKGLLDQAEKAAANLDAEAKELYAKISTQLGEKQGELKELKTRIEAMSPEDLLSDGGKALETQAAGLTSEIHDLKGQLQEMISRVPKG